MKHVRRTIAAIIVVIVFVSMVSCAFAAKIKITSPLYIRKGPGMKYSKVGVVGKGTVLKVCKASSNDGTLWFKITSGKYKGRYVSSQRTTTVSSPIDIWVESTATVFFRTKPTGKASLIQSFGSGKVLHCTGYANGWFRIRYNGVTGYIYGYHLKPA